MASIAANSLIPFTNQYKVKAPNAMQRKDDKLFNLILIVLLLTAVLTEHFPQFLQHPGADNELV